MLGYSWECIGRLLEAHTFGWKEAQHVNTHCHCIYTPIKGTTKFLIDKNDAFSTQRMMQKVLDDAEPLACDACNEKTRRYNFLRVDGAMFCGRCIVRLGIEVWDEEAKTYKLQGK